MGLVAVASGILPNSGEIYASSEMLRSRLKLSHVPLSHAGQPSGHCGHLGRGGLYDKRRRGDFFNRKTMRSQDEKSDD